MMCGICGGGGLICGTSGIFVRGITVVMMCCLIILEMIYTVSFLTCTLLSLSYTHSSSHPG